MKNRWDQWATLANFVFIIWSNISLFISLLSTLSGGVSFLACSTITFDRTPRRIRHGVLRQQSVVSGTWQYTFGRIRCGRPNDRRCDITTTRMYIVPPNSLSGVFFAVPHRPSSSDSASKRRIRLYFYDVVQIPKNRRFYGNVWLTKVVVMNRREISTDQYNNFSALSTVLCALVSDSLVGLVFRINTIAPITMGNAIPILVFLPYGRR